MKRIAVAFVTVAGVSSAQAGVEVGGTAGLHIFAENNALGSPESNVGEDPIRLANSAFFGIRLGTMFTQMLGLELEAGVIPSETDGPPGTVTIDVWNATARANVIAQFRAVDPSNNILPFITAGAGLMRVVDVGSDDESLWVKDDMKGLAFVGGGAKYRASGGWGVRGDVRVYMVPAHGDASVAAEVEILLGLYRDFGAIKRTVVEEKPQTTVAATDDDPDKDGIGGAADQCPNEAEDKDGFEDDNGCPDGDNDKDTIADATDKCPNESEDKDNFQDEDGCPDQDNDGDGVADAGDKCGDQPETRNGFQDEDGCPDELPKKLAQYTGTIAGINFKVNSADLLPASFKTLDKAVAVLTEFKEVKVEIQGHTDDQVPKAGGKFADNETLSQARAESVKAYFVKKGIADDRVIAKGYAATVPVKDPAGLKGPQLNQARTANRRVEFKLVSPGAEPPAPEPKADEPKADAPKADAPKADAPKTDAKGEKPAE
jgi:OOP family OmpA-OmpF porin